MVARDLEDTIVAARGQAETRTAEREELRSRF
jgi:hypothetical protein